MDVRAHEFEKAHLLSLSLFWAIKREIRAGDGGWSKGSLGSWGKGSSMEAKKGIPLGCKKGSP